MKKVLSFLLIVSILTGTCLSEGVFGWLSKNIAFRSLKYMSVAKSAFREENMRVIAADGESSACPFVSKTSRTRKCWIFT